MNPLQRRTSPFETPISEEKENQNQKAAKNSAFDTLESDFKEKPQTVEPKIAKPVPAATYFEEEEEEYIPVAPQKKKNVQPQRVYVQPQMVNREKYTSTMDQKLRRQIKLACVYRGIQFSDYIEQACREKLEREGVK